MKKLFLLMMVLLVGALAGCSNKDDGMLKISSDPGDAEVYIDGDRKGNTPAKKGQTYAIKLSEGDYTIEIIKAIENPSKYDQYYASKKVFVAEKALQTVSISLEMRQTQSYKEKWEKKQRQKELARAEKQRKKELARAEEQRQKEITRAEENQRKAEAQAKVIQSIQKNMLTIPSGSFHMGSNEYSSEKPIHTLHINSFKMSKYEVTQAQWQAVMGYTPRKIPVMNNPVEVSWDDIQKFLKKLNGQSSKAFRLPSEAEWEYAARAGSTTEYSWGNSVGRNRANCDGCGSQWDDNKSAPVGSFSPNSFGLYDIHGNVWEWVEDCWNSSYNGAPSDGRAWRSGRCDVHVLRGGSWLKDPALMRSSARYRDYAVYNFTYGFRLAQDN